MSKQTYIERKDDGTYVVVIKGDFISMAIMGDFKTYEYAKRMAEWRFGHGSHPGAAGNRGTVLESSLSETPEGFKFIPVDKESDR